MTRYDYYLNPDTSDASVHKEVLTNDLDILNDYSVFEINYSNVESMFENWTTLKTFFDINRNAQRVFFNYQYKQNDSGDSTKIMLFG